MSTEVDQQQQQQQLSMPDIMPTNSITSPVASIAQPIAALPVQHDGTGPSSFGDRESVHIAATNDEAAIYSMTSFVAASSGVDDDIIGNNHQADTVSTASSSVHSVSSSKRPSTIGSSSNRQSRSASSTTPYHRVVGQQRSRSTSKSPHASITDYDGVVPFALQSTNSMDSNNGAFFMSASARAAHFASSSVTMDSECPIPGASITKPPRSPTAGVTSAGNSVSSASCLRPHSFGFGSTSGFPVPPTTVTGTGPLMMSQNALTVDVNPSDSDEETTDDDEITPTMLSSSVSTPAPNKRRTSRNVTRVREISVGGTEHDVELALPRPMANEEHHHHCSKSPHDVGSNQTTPSQGAGSASLQSAAMSCHSGQFTNLSSDKKATVNSTSANDLIHSPSGDHQHPTPYGGRSFRSVSGNGINVHSRSESGAQTPSCCDPPLLQRGISTSALETSALLNTIRSTASTNASTPPTPSGSRAAVSNPQDITDSSHNRFVSLQEAGTTCGGQSSSSGSHGDVCLRRKRKSTSTSQSVSAHGGRASRGGEMSLRSEQTTTNKSSRGLASPHSSLTSSVMLGSSGEPKKKLEDEGGSMNNPLGSEGSPRGAPKSESSGSCSSVEMPSVNELNANNSKKNEHNGDTTTTPLPLAQQTYSSPPSRSSFSSTDSAEEPLRLPRLSKVAFDCTVCFLPRGTPPHDDEDGKEKRTKQQEICGKFLTNIAKEINLMRQPDFSEISSALFGGVGNDSPSPLEKKEHTTPFALPKAPLAPSLERGDLRSEGKDADSSLTTSCDPLSPCGLLPLSAVTIDFVSSSTSNNATVSASQLMSLSQGLPASASSNATLTSSLKLVPSEREEIAAAFIVSV